MSNGKLLPVSAHDSPTPEGASPHVACHGTTKKNLACPWRPEKGRRFCWRHDPERQEEKRARLSAIGKKGAARRNLNLSLGQKVSLKSADEIRACLERALERLERSNAAPLQKAGAVARLCGVAVQVRGQLDLEKDLQELREDVEAIKGTTPGGLYQ